jgi:hypothetical protein
MMIRTVTKQGLAVVPSLLLAFQATSVEAAGQQPAAPPNPGQGAPLSAEDLQGLLAPIALYPDALVTQILGASTLPDQIAAAGNWIRMSKTMSGTALMNAVDKQQRDPSGNAVTQFPSVLNSMANNLS